MTFRFLLEGLFLCPKSRRMFCMSKSLSLVNMGPAGHWVMSNYTGEVVRPWEIRKIFGMIRDFFLY